MSIHNNASAPTAVWHLGPFGHQQQAANAAAKIPKRAQFRLLVLGDPQLEGDSSLPDLRRDGQGMFPAVFALRSSEMRDWRLNLIWQALHGLITQDIPRIIEYGRKSLDLLGNDFYLAHIYRLVHAWTDPTHVSVLGDLLGSQWTSDEEFEKRSDRLWRRVFKDARELLDPNNPEGNVQIRAWEASVPILGHDKGWSKRIMAVAGNHDIGYAGDIDEKRIERFERRFGPVNWDIRFTLSPEDRHGPHNDSSNKPSLRIINLNSMNLDGPVKSSRLQGQTYDFLNNAILGSLPLPSSSTYGDDATILLTHIPLHKSAGVCADEPFFGFFSDDHGGGIKEQNHLSEHVSEQGILEGLFGMKGNQEYGNRGMGRNGIILTGHDHVGCDVWHFWDSLPEGVSEASDVKRQAKDSKKAFWNAARYNSYEADYARTAHGEMIEHPQETTDRTAFPGIREITVRSMMGDFGGNAGLLSAWFDDGLQQWRFEYASCSLGVQHIWWAIHVITLITCGLTVAALFAFALESNLPVVQEPTPPKIEYKELAEQREDAKEEVQELEKLATPEPRKQDATKTPISSLTRSESKKYASDMMKQRREKYQRSIRGRSSGLADGSPGLSKRISTANARRPSEKDWEVVEADSPG